MQFIKSVYHSRNEDDMTTKLTGIIKLNQEIQAHGSNTPLRYIMVCYAYILVYLLAYTLRNYEHLYLFFFFFRKFGTLCKLILASTSIVI